MDEAHQRISQGSRAHHTVDGEDLARAGHTPGEISHYVLFKWFKSK